MKKDDIMFDFLLIDEAGERAKAAYNYGEEYRRKNQSNYTIESDITDAFLEGAVWSLNNLPEEKKMAINFVSNLMSSVEHNTEEAMINKICDWLDKNLQYYVNKDGKAHYVMLTTDLRQAMNKI